MCEMMSSSESQEWVMEAALAVLQNANPPTALKPSHPLPNFLVTASMGLLDSLGALTEVEVAQQHHDLTSSTTTANATCINTMETM